jgi:DNA-binding cell septation regulator SpoVG
MKISIEHFAGKYPQFNVSLATKEGVEPFIVIKGCRLVNGSKGQFISWPAKKLDSGKYWNHVYTSEPFSNAVLEEVLRTMPKESKAKSLDEDIPF